MESVSHYLDTRYIQNKYAGMGHEKVEDINKHSKQYPKRMWRPNRNDPQTTLSTISTDKALDMILMQATHKEVRTGDEHLKDLTLANRHRYGDDVDILRTTFTKTKEEVDQERFELVRCVRNLFKITLKSLTTVPKQEKYVLGAMIRESALNLMRMSIQVKRRYYRKNILELMDVECDILREFYFNASTEYPEWVTAKILDDQYVAINNVSSIVGGLLKTTVC